MKDFFKLWLICIIIGAFMLIPLGYFFWPGTFANDTFSQMNQALGYAYIDDSHPVITILIFKLFFIMLPYLDNKLFYLFFQLAFVCFFTSLIVTVLIENFFKDIKFKSKFYLGFILMFIFCIAPPNGMYHISLLKDNYSTWLLVAFIVFIVSFFQSVFNKKENITLLYSAAILGGLSILFRHNAYTLIGPMIFLTPVIYLFIKQENFNIYFKRILLYFILFLSLYFIKLALVHNLTDKKHDLYWQSFDIKEWVVRNDFLMALKLNLPILTKENKEELSKIIDIDKTNELTGIGNSFYQLEFFDPSGNKIGRSKELIAFGTKILLSHPFQWAKIKYYYAKSLIVSNESYKLPRADLIDYKVPNDYHFDLNLNKDTQNIRDFIRYSSGLDGGFFIPRLLIWNFKAMFYFNIILSFLIIFSYLFRFKNLSLEYYLRQKGIYLILFIIPIISSFLLSFPLLLCSASNDYRYFWPCVNYTLILIILSFGYIIKFKKEILNWVKDNKYFKIKLLN